VIKQFLASVLVRVLARFDYTLARLSTRGAIPVDLPPEVVALITQIGEFTKTSPERIYALHEAVRYIEKRRVPGAIVECGVWRGGSMMAAAQTLVSMRSTHRDFYLFDTYNGMTEPSAVDRDLRGTAATALMENSTRDSNIWSYASKEEVRHNLSTTGYPMEHLRFIEGRVEDTIPAHAPDQIALLRLDTDWYESTAHELNYLVPRMAEGAVLIIDDYGHWQGARKAVDEYFTSFSPAVLLTRVDYSGRMCIINRDASRSTGPLASAHDAHVLTTT
jgi:O-methyltransferase